ncbi:MAG: site-specific DNA-methyltransferase [Chloroflexi bacterium]|nr:site-specific DNA-methyltransferase [Chloroflexota bacterium]
MRARVADARPSVVSSDQCLDDAREASRVLVGDCQLVLKTLPSASVRTCVTSPPYWGLRDYEVPRDAQLGAEEDPDEYVSKLVAVFDEVARVLTEDGTVWLNLGDSYTSGNRTWRATDRKNPAREMSYRPPTPEGLKPKDLVGIPWRVAFALQEAGWYLRSDIIWHKPNCQPESVRDRPTQSHEYLFLLSKSLRYYYDTEAAREAALDGGARNRRTVWSIPTEPNREAHFAKFPPALVEPCVLAGTEEGDAVLDPFFGSGTVGTVANQLGRSFIGIELRPEYAAIAARRTGATVMKASG